jgi:hypothetical protein
MATKDPKEKEDVKDEKDAIDALDSEAKEFEKVAASRALPLAKAHVY